MAATSGEDEHDVSLKSNDQLVCPFFKLRCGDIICTDNRTDIQ